MIPHHYPNGVGWVEVIAGCMFSGKTEELIRRLHRARIARQEVVVFKPTLDSRYGTQEVVSHSDDRIPCIPVSEVRQIIESAGSAQVVGIDEAQFFDNSLIEVIEELANDGVRVVVAGLDQDFRGVPFEPMPQLLAVAEHITKTLAVCTVCGSPANRSQRLVHRNTRVLLGASESYEARCRRHWNPDVFDPHQESLPLVTG